MAKPKYDNALILSTMRLVNLALPLEYAIRAIKQSTPDEYERLKSIDTRIHEVWRQFDLVDDQIKELGLNDFAWDYLQLGRQSNFAYARVYNQDAGKILNGDLTAIKSFAKEVSTLSLPFFAKNFRYCDLLNGNDVPRLLTKTQDILKIVKNYDRETAIPISKFAFFIRIPVPLIQELQISDAAGTKLRNGEILDNAMLVAIPGDKPILNFQAVLDELSLEYTKNRMRYLGALPEERVESSPGCLIKDTLNRKVQKLPSREINKYNELVPLLTGLYCWDLNQNHDWNYIVKQLSNEFNIDIDISHIRKYYNKTKKKIDGLVAESRLPLN